MATLFLARREWPDICPGLDFTYSAVAREIEGKRTHGGSLRQLLAGLPFFTSQLGSGPGGFQFINSRRLTHLPSCPRIYCMLAREPLQHRRIETVPRYQPLLGLCPLQRLRAMAIALAHE